MAARILVIEDNPANLELMVYLLQAHGHLPRTACDGDQGLEAARREPLDLILCDIQMPKVSGYEVARQLQQDQALKLLPLVAVTAFAMVGDRDKILASGFHGYIAKPIDPESFVQQVEVFLPGDLRTASPVGSAATTTSPPPVAGRQRILVVDNLEVNLSLKRSILEPSGYEVVVALDMDEGFALALQAPPDLIISDVGMSHGTGFDFIRKVKAEPRLQTIPFIFITSTHNNEEARARGLALGAVRFLFRPIDPQVLLTEIRTYLPQTEDSARGHDPRGG